MSELNVSFLSNPAIIRDTVHENTHEGLVFVVSHIFVDITDEDDVDYLIQVGDSSQHSAFAADGGGNARFIIYENPTFTASGTGLQAFNLNRKSDNKSKGTFSHSPTVTDPGTAIFSVSLPGGNKHAAVGGEGGGLARAGQEIILGPNTNYLVRLTNLAGSTQSLSFDHTFYEPVVEFEVT